MAKKNYYFGENHCTQICAKRFQQAGGKKYKPAKWILAVFEQVRKALILLIKILDFDNNQQGGA